jgi:peroxiredoxin
MEPVIAPGEPAPDFELTDLAGRRRRLSDQKGHVTVLHIWSALCPWTDRTDAAVLEAATSHGADLWSIASNADETQDVLRRESDSRQLPVVLLDPDQRVSDLYGAVATPHVFVIDAGGVVRYHGAVDDARFRQPVPRHRFLAEALAAVRRGQDPEPGVTPTYGCAIVRAA